MLASLNNSLVLCLELLGIKPAGPIRLAVCTTQGKEKIKYQLEEMTSKIKNIAKSLEVTDENIRPNINISGYI